MKEQSSVLNGQRETKVQTPQISQRSPLTDQREISKSKVVGSLLSAKSKDSIYNVSPSVKSLGQSQISIPSIKKVIPISQNFLKAQTPTVYDNKEGSLILQQSSYFKKISNSQLEKFQFQTNNSATTAITQNIQNQNQEIPSPFPNDLLIDKKKVLVNINTNRLQNPNSQSLKIIQTEKHPAQMLDPIFKKHKQILNEPTLANLKLRLNQNSLDKHIKHQESSDSNFQKQTKTSHNNNIKLKGGIGTVENIIQNQQTKKYLQSIWKRTELAKQENQDFPNPNSYHTLQKAQEQAKMQIHQMEKLNYKTLYGQGINWQNQQGMPKSNSHQILSTAQEQRQKKLKTIILNNNEQTTEHEITNKLHMPSEEKIKTQIAPLDLKEFKLETSQKQPPVTQSRQRSKNAQFLKYSALSKAGKNVRQQMKTNQDSYSMIKGFCGPQTNWFFGVFDGHGMNGHTVSDFVSKSLPIKIQQLTNQKVMSVRAKKYVSSSRVREKSPQEQLSPSLVDINTFDEYSIKDILVQSYQWVNEQIQYQGYDVQFSATTAVTLLVSKELFIVANVGDSKCVIYKQNHQDLSPWETDQISRDHKPNINGECERIMQMKGRIESYKDSLGNNVGPMRVWLQNEDLPGLAMSRSIGDLVAESVGVIPIPDVKVHKRNIEQDRALVLCSDGVSEFMSNEEIGNIIEPYYLKNDTEGACRKLIEEATQTWQKEEIVIDDITAIVIFFH